MGEKVLLLLLLLLVSLSLIEVDGKNQGREEVQLISDKSNGRSPMFILSKFKKVVKSEGGEVKVVSGHRWKGDINPMHIGFITMEPNTLFIPQYVDANLILFVQTGEVKVGWIQKDELVEERMKMGDVNVIPAGSAFYFVNVGNDNESLSIICSIDASGTSGWNSYQSFFIGGGRKPTSVITGFGVKTLTAAFNVSTSGSSLLLKH
ncbi:putative rmlC-like cupin domain superfamily, rmlC-like jelly roll protein [Dioscorea sansibarensis]